MTRENLSSYNGVNNVTKITGDDGSVNYLSQSKSFGDEVYETGSVGLNTFENEKKHVLFLFNEAGAETGRYYLGKKLQGKSAQQLVEMKHQLCFFKSFNPKTNAWVPCVGLSSQEDLSKTMVRF